jgi:Na+/H+-dicarboxylate symporter
MEKQERDLFSRVLSLLRNFWVNLLAIGLGILIGLTSKETATELIPVGKLYLALLAMTVLPIVFSAITHSLGQLLRSGNAGTYLLRLVIVFCLSVLLASTVGVIGGLIGDPGRGMSSTDHSLLGKLLLCVPAQSVHQATHPPGFVDFVTGIVPQNIFRAFTSGKSLAVIFVSILMGVALGVNPSQASGRLLEVVRGVYETFLKILNWALYALPFGLCCLMAGQIAVIGTDYLFTLSKLVALFYVCCGVLCLVYLAVIRVVTGHSVLTIVRAFRDPLTVAFVASNSLVAMPIAFRHLEDDLDQPHDLVELVVPLGLVMNRHAYPLLFSLMAVFTAQVYGHTLSVPHLIELSFAAALTGMAAIGPAASVAPMLGFVIAPLGLPIGLGIATLVETTSIVTPMVAMTHLFGSSAAATLIGAGKASQTTELPNSGMQGAPEASSSSA